MPIYTFRMPAADPPPAVTVKTTPGGVTVATGTASNTGSFSADLPLGDYVMANNGFVTGPAYVRPSPYTPDTTAVTTEAATQFAKQSRQRVAAFDPLRIALSQASRSCAVQVLGDSTGNETFEWPYLFAQYIASLYPAYTVQHRLWSDATQDYALPTTIQTGTAGALYLDGTTGTKTRKMDSSVSPAITGPLDVRVKLSMPDWSPAVTSYFCAKTLGADPNRGWYFGVNTGGALVFVSSADGNAATLVTKSSTALVNGWANDSINWVRCTYTPDNGAAGYDVKFYTSADGITWTQLGATVTTAGARTINNVTGAGYEIGGQAALTTGIKIYEVQFRNGIDGPLVAPTLPDLYPPYDVLSAPVTGAPVFTVVNGSYPGATIAYLGDSTRLPKMTPDYGQLAAFLSDSHNEGFTVGTYWNNYYNTWLTAVMAALKRAISPIIITQNPQNGATWALQHSNRRLDSIAYARSKGYGLIDTYGACLAGGFPGGYMQDTIHPNAAGQQIWFNEIKAAYNA